MGSLIGGKIAVQTQTFDKRQQEELLMTTQATTSRTNRSTNRGNKVTVTPEMVRQAVEKMQQEQPTVVYGRPPMSPETKAKISAAQKRSHALRRGVAMPIATNGKFTSHIDTVIATIKNLPWSFEPSAEEIAKVEELKVMLESFTKHFGKK